MSRINADQLRETFGTRHEADHVVVCVVRVDHQRSARRHSSHVVPTFDHRPFDQHDNVRLFVLVSKFVLDNVITYATILTRRTVGAIRIVNIVFHRLRVLAFETSGRRDGIDNVAAFFIHDDAARPNSKFRISHNQPRSYIMYVGNMSGAYPRHLRLSFTSTSNYCLMLPRSESSTARKSLRNT